MKLLTLIIPCFNEYESIDYVYEEVTQVVRGIGIDYEIIFVNDGSSDGTLDKIRMISENDEHIQYISFSRNYGKEAAMYAGLCNAKGDYVAIMDADLQDPPSLLPEMISILENGEYDNVATRRMNRKGEPLIRSWFAKRFYRFINRYSDFEIIDGARDFRLMKREMVDAIVAMGEYNRFSKGLYGWVGFRTYCIEFENIPRVAGETKWSFWKLLRYAIDGIVSFTEVPLKIASFLGIFFTVVSFCALLFIVIRRIVFGDPVAGWASMICIIIFIGGIQLAVLGVIGEYLAKTYMETKKRPHYIISESNIKNINRIK